MEQVIGRLQAALASATNEVTYEAPKEFHPVGQLLSNRRKRDAEDGKSHTTARRLAALFAGVCPKTPALIKAYGKRASDIATQATKKISPSHFNSIFSQYTGVDATSMWAAATSSQDAEGGAIHVHLLACMLASVWEPPEAISIWAEIVEQRRLEIALEVDRGGSVPFATAVAANQAEIPRQQLAEWDASARAWLEVANSVKEKEQKKLGLILPNIETSMGPLPNTYPNVKSAWAKAVATMGNLVSGIPQEVSDGPAIIGLSAWHLYPDMHVFGRRNVEIHMKDDLIPPGGILTLGCSPSNTTSKSGITWSLSLAKLKFYGSPVQATTSLQGDSSRLTVDQFRLVLLGCVLRTWNMAPTDDATNVSELRIDFHSVRPWYGCMALLEKAAKAYLSHDDIDTETFVNLGRNRPIFGPLTPGGTLNYGCGDARWLDPDLVKPVGVQVGEEEVDDEMTDVGDSDTSSMSDRDSELGGGLPTSIVTPLGVQFDFYFGDPDLACVFLPAKTLSKVPVARFLAGDITWALGCSMQYNVESITEPDRFNDPMLAWLSKLNYGLSCLGSLTDPVISIRTLDRSIESSKWAKDWDLYEIESTNAGKGKHAGTTAREFVSKSSAMPVNHRFSVLAYFLSGCDIGHSEIHDTANCVSVGNSIYVPNELLRDPLQSRAGPRDIVRILGNIGQPGLVIFSSVKEPMIASTDDGAWRVVSKMASFDGRPEDLFGSTSMHLGFTAWERSMDMADSHGKQDVQFTKMESVISIRDSGTWVGDVDVMAAMRSPHIYSLSRQPPCHHKPGEPMTLPLKSIGNWDELRECQSGLAVVRAHGNWLARLVDFSIATVSTKLEWWRRR
ncbi:hypothetical protein QBC34DRAFT_449178 [Podospora aff. communis PSN243]|uniref:Ig-like domain-containing protein n=1 Tax=Podospora aff. communis PSN243 TaxID=3040156 RepID=A0AAV9GL52_9PEZI|nr:hypothetical protein QBC34DRAFT_449178 [Podospora aff. communis PSN243]